MAVLESIKFIRIHFERRRDVPENAIMGCEFRIQIRKIDATRGGILMAARFFEGDPDPPFRLDVDVEGVFSFVSAEDAESFLQTSGPSILFPHLRDEIASITHKAGLKPVVLPPLVKAEVTPLKEEMN